MSYSEAASISDWVCGTHEKSSASRFTQSRCGRRWPPTALAVADSASAAPKIPGQVTRKNGEKRLAVSLKKSLFAGPPRQPPFQLLPTLPLPHAGCPSRPQDSVSPRPRTLPRRQPPSALRSGLSALLDHHWQPMCEKTARADTTGSPHPVLLAVHLACLQRDCAEHIASPRDRAYEVANRRTPSRESAGVDLTVEPSDCRGRQANAIIRVMASALPFVLLFFSVLLARPGNADQDQVVDGDVLFSE